MQPIGANEGNQSHSVPAQQLHAGDGILPKVRCQLSPPQRSHQHSILHGCLHDNSKGWHAGTASPLNLVHFLLQANRIWNWYGLARQVGGQETSVAAAAGCWFTMGSFPWLPIYGPNGPMHRRNKAIIGCWMVCQRLAKVSDSQ